MGISVVIQWLRICLPRGHGLHPGRSHMPQGTCAAQVLSTHSRACALQQHRPLKWEAHTPQLKSGPHSLQLEKSWNSNEDLAQPKIINFLKSFIRWKIPILSLLFHTHAHTEVLFVALIDISKLPAKKSYTLSKCSHHECMECPFPHSFINNTSLTLYFCQSDGWKIRPWWGLKMVFSFHERLNIFEGFPGGTVIESVCQCRRCKRCRSDSWVRKIPWSRKWQLALVFLPGKFNGQRSLATVHGVTKSQTQLSYWAYKYLLHFFEPCVASF